MFLWAGISSLRKKIEQIFLHTITLVGLLFTYLFGIGLTSVLGKLIGKRFLPISRSWKQINSSWQPTAYQHSQPDRMF